MLNDRLIAILNADKAGREKAAEARDAAKALRDKAYAEAEDYEAALREQYAAAREEAEKASEARVNKKRGEVAARLEKSKKLLADALEANADRWAAEMVKDVVRTEDGQ